MEYSKICQEDIQALGKIIPAERIHTGTEIPKDYSHDEMPVYGLFPPDVVIEVINTQEISGIMEYAKNNRIPVTPRGAGTGLCGGSVPVFGGILLLTGKMNRIIETDETNLTITVEPGLLLSDLKKHALEHGLAYPPDPGEKGASIGGNVMTNAGGMRAIKYGVTRDYVKGMEAVLPGGEIITLGGKISKNSSGYSLLDLMIGSEGTLAVVTKLILHLIPAPKATASLLVPFPDVSTCINTVPAIMRSGASPAAVEFMENGVIAAAEIFSRKKFPYSSSNAYLLLLFDGPSSEDVEKQYMEAAEICLAGGAEDIFIADTETNLAAIWGIRDVFLEAIKHSTDEMDECDVVVPVGNIANFINFTGTLGSKYGLRILSFGHAGDGNIHVYVCKDNLPPEIWNAKVLSAMQDMYDMAGKLGGQISGEHGIGHAKLRYLSESAGPVCLSLMRSVKAAFDPENILNPGKIIAHE